MLKGWEAKGSEAVEEGAEAIEEELERMRGLVEGLLTLARGDEGLPMRHGLNDLGEVAEEAAEAARAGANGKLAIRYEAPAAAVEASFDRDRVRRVADALLDNAVKYTPDGGEVAVTVVEEDGRARLSVSDTGVGIPRDQLPLIFERFHRTDEARAMAGSGLGLAIARQISEAHGGTIAATSELGKGSAFALSIPRERPPFRTPPPPGSPKIAPPLPSSRAALARALTREPDRGRRVGRPMPRAPSALTILLLRGGKLLRVRSPGEGEHLNVRRGSVR